MLTRPMPSAEDEKRLKEKIAALLSEYPDQDALKNYYSFRGNEVRVFRFETGFGVVANGINRLPPPLFNKVFNIILQFESGRF